MDMFITCLQYFCYGYTAVTMVGTSVMLSLAYWAEISNKRHLNDLLKDKDSE